MPEFIIEYEMCNHIQETIEVPNMKAAWELACIRENFLDESDFAGETPTFQVFDIEGEHEISEFALHRGQR